MEIVRFHQVLGDKEVVFCYKGLLNEDLTTALLHQLEVNLQTLEPDSLTRKRVYSILIECLQNISHHSERGYTAGTTDVNSILVYSHQHFYAIHTCNIILNANKESLLAKLYQISRLTGTQIQEEYRKILGDGRFSGKGTAGLGFLDIAKKANQRFVYSVERVSDLHSQFYFTVYIAKGPRPEHKTDYASTAVS